MSTSDTPRVVSTLVLTGTSGSQQPSSTPSVAQQKLEQQVREEKRKMANKLEVLSDRRDLLMAKLLRMDESVQPETVSIHLLTLHLETLRRCADEYDKINSEMSVLLPKEQRAWLSKEYVNFETVHNQLYIALQTKVTKIHEAENPKVPQPQGLAMAAAPQQVYVHAAAPQLHAPFPTFDGNAENWYSFKNLFKTIMNRYSNEAPAMKILHLRSSLVGEAKDKIDQDVVNNNDYDAAWKILENAYEDKRLIMDTHIDAILDCPKVSRENRGKSISKLVEICVKHSDALSSHGFPVEGLGELFLVNVVYKKLDKETQEQWEMKLARGELPDYDEFMEFLREKGRVLQRTNRMQPQVSQQATVPMKQRQGFNPRTPVQVSSQSFVQTSKEICVCCKADHSIYRCEQFQQLSVQDRKLVVMRASLCYNCLKPRHRVIDCPSEQGCKAHGCGRKHHSLLHFGGEPTVTAFSLRESTSQPTESIADLQPDKQEFSGATTLCGQVCAVKQKVLLSTAEVLVVGKEGSTTRCRALLDSGSDSHIMTERIASKLMLKMDEVNLPISGLNDIQTRVKYLVSTRINSCVNAFSTSVLDFLVVPRITSSLPVVEIDIRTWPLPSGLPLADPSFNEPGEIDMIIGNEIFFDLVKQGRMKIGDNATTLAETELGWVVGGAVHTRKSRPNIRVCHLNHHDETLNETMMKFWEIEDVRTEGTLTAAEADIEEHFRSTHTRDTQGRYQVRFPFNQFKDQIGESYDIARKRLQKLMISLAKDPVKRKQYTEFMDEYLSLGHMKEVDKPTEGGYYIPHHAVFKASSSTTKTRVVFDASAKSTSGISLNNALLVGPTVQSDLLSIILRFCAHRVVLTADIPKMYRQIRLHEDDAKYQLILWWGLDGQQKVYELQTVTYGVASSPYHATRALMQLASDEGEEFPLAMSVVQKDSYIDDFLTGGQSAETVIRIYRELSILLGRGGFGAHKFCSNSPEVLKEIPEDLQEKQVSFEEQGINNTIKTLGLIWNPLEDYFVFHVQPLDNGSISTTKRKVLSDIGRLFDPLGFLGPIITSAKLVMQDIWRLGLDWDEQLPDVLLQQWKRFRQQLPAVNEMRKQRCVIPGDAAIIELHGFSDASKRAYGAVIYIRTISLDGTINVNLVASKSRVSPLKQMTIPRLELCGAKLLAELTVKVVSVMDVTFDDVILHCDSQIVLCWFKKPPSVLKEFVYNRVVPVVQMTNGFHWRYIRSEDNPADLVSRGVLPEELLTRDLWWKGSPVLWQPNVQTSVPEPIDEEVLPEIKSVTVLVVVKTEPQINLNRLSNFRRMQRAWVYVLRFIEYVVSRTRQFTAITSDDIIKSERAMFLILQGEIFGSILNILKTKSNKRHNLSALAPFLGDDGLLRVGGRLKYSAIPYEGKHQVLLPEKHHVTECLIRKLHEEHHHVGQGGLLAIVRERYWPIRAKMVIKRIISKCQVCARLRAVPGNQFMGNLPECRVNPAPVFSKVGVDYAGPFMLKLGGRSTKLFKAYVVVFVCMAVKAIHFELVSNLTTSNFIAALHRFTSRRGIPSDIYSDNGTGFVGADHELAALRVLFEDQQQLQKVNEYCVAKGIRWHFIPPRSPHFGGIWEAGVKSMKHHLKRVVGETRLTYEEMATFLAQTEAILNSRPLFPMSDDPNDMNILTPSHFLIGRSAVALPEPSYEDEKVGRLSRWQHIQLMQQHFWRRWSKEYLHNLQGRQKWNDGVKLYKVGALVILVEENVPPQQWRRGRITEVHPGDDDVVRVVTVKTATSAEYKRAVTKIAVLPSVEPEASTGGECSGNK